MKCRDRQFSIKNLVKCFLLREVVCILKGDDKLVINREKDMQHKKHSVHLTMKPGTAPGFVQLRSNRPTHGRQMINEGQEQELLLNCGVQLVLQ